MPSKNYERSYFNGIFKTIINIKYSANEKQEQYVIATWVRFVVC